MTVRRYFCIGTNRYTKFYSCLEKSRKEKKYSLFHIKRTCLIKLSPYISCKMLLLLPNLLYHIKLFIFKKLNITLSALVIPRILNRVSKQGLIGDKKYTYGNFE